MIVLLIGTLATLLAIYPLGLGKGNLAHILQVPWYYFSGGVLLANADALKLRQKHGKMTIKMHWGGERWRSSSANHGYFGFN
ncbi:MAG TPA: hypothetical protein DCQ14_03310 [Firmicutes bacterium]|nr:hypothetical protein [Bacillota bacterium]